MSIILNIETSSKNCSVCLSSTGKILSCIEKEDKEYRHSELLTSSIQKILIQNNLSVNDLSAISVGIGPGSFTGLRIGLSVVKGLCYPHNIKLIGLSSLKIIANSLLDKNKNIISLIKDKGEHFYMSVFNSDLKEIIQPKVQQIDSDSIKSILDKKSIIVVNSDDAYEYISKIIKREVDIFKRTISSVDMIRLSHKLFDEKKFEDIAYIEPLYIKKPYVS
tara:strand:+ start:5910 stop:6569 length:660 start_codon:yes stop_codon:yes gene_type:complete